jgi:hypothetical protein
MKKPHIACLITLSLGLLVVGCGQSAPSAPAAAADEPSVASALGVPVVSAAVRPISWSALNATVPTNANALRLRDILRNANEYGLTTWWNTVKNFDEQSGSYLDFGGNGEHSVRPAAGEALAVTVALKLGAYDAGITGVSDAAAQAIALKLVRSLAFRHLSNSSGGWGNVWQSALWTALTGTAGWLLWDDLPDTDREYVRRMVEYEADRFIGSRVPYFRNDAGAVQSSGDSKAEENSWNATVLQLATAMMPEHPRADAWMFKNAELMISAYARPSNTTNTSSLFHGRSLAWWLRGSNANEDFTVINHSRIHPDYMITVTQNLRAGLIYPMARLPTPKAFGM